MRHELKRREVTVSRVERLSPGFVAVTFADPSLCDLVSDSFDDHVKLMLPGQDGELVRRDYTPRRVDTARGELTLEFALHGEGRASAWAREAQVGARVSLGGPRGSMIIPMDHDWQVLVGDASALPAIHRRVEELPDGARVITVVQLADDADRRAFTGRAKMHAIWTRTDEDLVQAVRSLELPEGEGHVWCAGEATLMARIRRTWLDEKHHPSDFLHVSAYWNRGIPAHHEHLSA